MNKKKDTKEDKATKNGAAEDLNTEANGKPELQGRLYLFNQPEILTKRDHGDLGFSPIDNPFEFASKSRSVPVTLSEFHVASKYYPIVFASEDNPIPLAILGLQEEVNLFVDEQGKWEDMAYIPGYIRRYPLAFAKQEGLDKYAVVIDRAHESISKKPKFPFFDGDELTEELKQGAEFCRQYEADRITTENFIDTLKKYNLLSQQAVHFTPKGETEEKPFASYVGIDEKRLKELSNDKFLELREKHILPLIYVHLSSMANWRSLLERRARRFNLSQDDLMKNK